MEQFPVTREQIDGLMAFVARSADKAPSEWRKVIGMRAGASV